MYGPLRFSVHDLGRLCRRPRDRPATTISRARARARTGIAAAPSTVTPIGLAGCLDQSIPFVRPVGRSVGRSVGHPFFPWVPAFGLGTVRYSTWPPPRAGRRTVGRISSAVLPSTFLNSSTHIRSCHRARRRRRENVWIPIPGRYRSIYWMFSRILEHLPHTRARTHTRTRTRMASTWTTRIVNDHDHCESGPPSAGPSGSALTRTGRGGALAGTRRRRRRRRRLRSMLTV